MVNAEIGSEVLLLTFPKSKDSSYHYIHFKSAHLADLFEVCIFPFYFSFAVVCIPFKYQLTHLILQEFSRPQLPNEEIYVPPQHQPINPEDEDDVVPDQHAAFGIQRATQAKREPAWKDLGLEELVLRGPKEGDSAAVTKAELEKGRSNGGSLR